MPRIALQLDNALSVMVSYRIAAPSKTALDPLLPVVNGSYSEGLLTFGLSGSSGAPGNAPVAK